MTWRQAEITTNGGRAFIVNFNDDGNGQIDSSERQGIVDAINAEIARNTSPDAGAPSDGYRSSTERHEIGVGSINWGTSSVLSRSIPGLGDAGTAVTSPIARYFRPVPETPWCQREGVTCAQTTTASINPAVVTRDGTNSELLRLLSIPEANRTTRDNWLIDIGRSEAVYPGDITAQVRARYSGQTPPTLDALITQRHNPVDLWGDEYGRSGTIEDIPELSAHDFTQIVRWLERNPIATRGSQFTTLAPGAHDDDDDADNRACSTGQQPPSCSTTPMHRDNHYRSTVAAGFVDMHRLIRTATELHQQQDRRIPAALSSSRNTQGSFTHNFDDNNIQILAYLLRGNHPNTPLSDGEKENARNYVVAYMRIVHHYQEMTGIETNRTFGTTEPTFTNIGTINDPAPPATRRMGGGSGASRPRESGGSTYGSGGEY